MTYEVPVVPADPSGVPSSVLWVGRQVSTESDPGWAAHSRYCLVIPNQIKTGSCACGRPHDLVLLATTNPDFGEPPLGYTDYDIVFAREDGGGHENTGVFILDLPIKVRQDWSITDNANAPLLTFMGETGGQVRVAATLIGDQGTNDNLIVRLGGASGKVAFQNAAGTVDRIRIEDGFVRIDGSISFTGTGVTGSAPAVSASSNRLDLRGGSAGTRFVNNAFSAVNLTISDSGDVEVHRGNMILKSPNGTRYRVTVADDGTLSTTAA